MGIYHLSVRQAVPYFKGAGERIEAPHHCIIFQIQFRYCSNGQWDNKRSGQRVWGAQKHPFHEGDNLHNLVTTNGWAAYWNKIASGLWNSVVVLRIIFLLFCTTNQGNCGDLLWCESCLPSNQIITTLLESNTDRTTLWVQLYQCHVTAQDQGGEELLEYKNANEKGMFFRFSSSWPQLSF